MVGFLLFGWKEKCWKSSLIAGNVLGIERVSDRVIWVKLEAGGVVVNAFSSYTS